MRDKWTSRHWLVNVEKMTRMSGDHSVVGVVATGLAGDSLAMFGAWSTAIGSVPNVAPCVPHKQCLECAKRTAMIWVLMCNAFFLDKLSFRCRRHLAVMGELMWLGSLNAAPPMAAAHTGHEARDQHLWVLRNLCSWGTFAHEALAALHPAPETRGENCKRRTKKGAALV